MLPLIPALLLALFAAWSGSFEGAAAFSGAVSGHLALLAAAAWGGRVSRDPLRLGWGGQLLLAALLLVLAASWWASPVRRAGVVGLALLPAFLLLPAVVARCWSGERAGRLGLRAVALVVAGVALWGLGDGLLGLPSRPVQPLGHHNLLAAWLVTLLPLAVVVVARRRGGWRWAGAAAGVAAVAAVLASRSLLGLLALAVQLLVLALGHRRLRPWAALAALAVVASRWSRLVALAAGTDPSLLARKGYLQAGWTGWWQRPVLGWGPGSVPWTAGAFLRPRPGINPPGEVVGQLHALPLDLAYQSGLPALLLAAAVVGLFVLRRKREARADAATRVAADPLLLQAGLLGLLGAGVTALGSEWLTVPALPVAVAVAAGAALAGGRPSPPGALQPLTPGGRIGRWGAPAYALAAALVLLPLDRALWHYERARLAPEAAAVQRHLERAVALDPAFPLYRARAAWYGAGDGPELAREAAREAPGVAALWLSAGALGVGAGEPWALDTLARARALDPLGGIAPYLELVAEPAAPGAPHCGARALLGEPRLAAALFWKGREGLLAATLERVRTWPGIDLGWREALAVAAAPPLETTGAVQDLAVGREKGVAALSLYAFRRRPWAGEWFSVEVRAGRLPGLNLPPASALPGSSPEAFSRGGCAPPAS